MHLSPFCNRRTINVHDDDDDDDDVCPSLPCTHYNTQNMDVKYDVVSASQLFDSQLYSSLTLWDLLFLSAHSVPTGVDFWWQQDSKTGCRSFDE